MTTKTTPSQHLATRNLSSLIVVIVSLVGAVSEVLIVDAFTYNNKIHSRATTTMLSAVPLKQQPNLMELDENNNAVHNRSVMTDRRSILFAALVATSFPSFAVAAESKVGKNMYEG